MNTPGNTPKAQLENLLQETPADAKEREKSEFDRLAGTRKDSIVLFGAMRMGRRTLAALRTRGMEPVAFADNNPQLWDTQIDGLTVYSPADAAARFGKTSVFVITIWGRGSSDTMASRVQRLNQLGATCVVPFIPLHWKHADLLLPHNALHLPHHVLENAPDVLRAFNVLADEPSRDQFVRQIEWRLTGDFDVLSDPVSDEIYFPSEIKPAANETFVDCGAFDGDTILRFLERRNGSFHKALAFEPDPQNLEALRKTVANLAPEIQSKVEVFPYALGDVACTVNFSATGTLGAAIGSGDFEVQCVRLDDALRNESPTYIKMDIESYEPKAIQGCAQTIQRCQPVIAACSYHIQDHAWTLPLVLHDVNPDYAILQRQHIQLVEDLVTYAVPKSRLAA